MSSAFEGVLMAFLAVKVAESAPTRPSAHMRRWQRDGLSASCLDDPTRWNDLYKYMYVDGDLFPLNPISCLNYRSVPPDAELL